ncbi:1286_t:CDS:2, partial [Funneliformis geosporum]
MMKAKLVCKQTLAEFALRLNLESRLKFGKGALITNEKILEDAFETYIDAVFLDSDENFLEVMNFMKPLLELKVEQLLLEKKNAQQNDTLNLNRSSGFENKKVENKHNQPQFTFEVVINGITYSQGTARNKSEAKELAAINTLNLIGDT